MSVPSFYIPKPYAGAVLIGNWSEDRCQYQKHLHRHDSSYRVDYHQQNVQTPDLFLRKRGTLRSDGLQPKFLLYHHGDRYMGNLITWHDEHFGKRSEERQADPRQRLPDLRNFSSHVMAWVPEKTDHPIQGAPTKWGLLDRKREQWRSELELYDPRKVGTSMATNYSSAYQAFPTEVVRESRRPKYLSSVRGVQQPFAPYSPESAYTSLNSSPSCDDTCAVPPCPDRATTCLGIGAEKPCTKSIGTLVDGVKGYGSGAGDAGAPLLRSYTSL